jgi:hypothetical protein
MTASAVQCSNVLTARWSATVDGGETTAFSGAAVWPLLAYLAGAADGEARRELEAAVGVDSVDAANAAGELIAVLGSSAAVRAGISVWTAALIELSAWWTEAVPADAQGRLGSDRNESQAAIDSWVRRRSASMIERLPFSITEESLVLLAAVLAAKTSWEVPFEGTMLIPGPGSWAGRRLAGLHRSTPDLDDLSVVRTRLGTVTMVTVSGHDDLVVELVLGEEGREANEVLAAALDALTSGQPRKPGSHLDDRDGAPGVTVGVAAFLEEPRLLVDVPRFSVSAEHDLLAYRDLFGLEAATDTRVGHFPGMSIYPLAIGAARQGIAATFTEEGFEAAAVTAVSAVAGGMPLRRPKTILVSFDRPFAFVARLRSSGLVLLAGWVGDAEDFRWPPDQAVEVPTRS